MLRNVGAYTPQMAGATVTLLPGGKLLVFGFDPIKYGVRDEAGHLAVTLRNRCDVPVFGNTGGQSVGYTKLWLWNTATETSEAAPALNVPCIFCK